MCVRWCTKALRQGSWGCRCIQSTRPPRHSLLSPHPIAQLVLRPCWLDSRTIAALSSTPDLPTVESGSVGELARIESTDTTDTTQRYNPSASASPVLALLVVSSLRAGRRGAVGLSGALSHAKCQV
jgi:hypothetical protein